MLMLVQGGRGTAAGKAVVSCPELSSSISIARGTFQAQLCAAPTTLASTGKEWHPPEALRLCWSAGLREGSFKCM